MAHDARRPDGQHARLDQHESPDQHAPAGERPSLGGQPRRQPYIPQVSRRRAAGARLSHLGHSTSFAAAVMLAAALVSLVVANTPAHGAFAAFWHAEVTLGLGAATVGISLGHVVNDVLMAVFFLLVGLEIKYELVAGELRDPRAAALPVIAALGGALVPMGIYLAINAGLPTAGGWGVPMATDIAFALGVLALLGSRVPPGLKVFLSTLAVADDIIAIVVIALFYGHAPDLRMLVLAAVVVVALVALSRAHVYALAPYLALGCVLWVLVYLSGVHATIAGVLLALTIPCRTHVDAPSFADWARDRVEHARGHLDPRAAIVGQQEFLDAVHELEGVAHHVSPPATRLARALHPWVYFAILPLFALANADVSLAGLDVSDAATVAAFAGIAAGLVVGKPVGVMLTSLVLVKAGVAELPRGVRWAHMLGAGLLAGVGFTMAIFVANLAYVDAAYVTAAKAGILGASLVAGIVGYLTLRRVCGGPGGR